MYTNIYIQVYRFNPVESNHRDGPMSHKKCFGINVNFKCITLSSSHDIILLRRHFFRDSIKINYYYNCMSSLYVLETHSNDIVNYY